MLGAGRPVTARCAASVYGQPRCSRGHRQRDQPEGVPPLELTGERTLPDVPEENYWFRRHLAVYEWIAERVRGRCGSSTSPAARATAPTCSRAPRPTVVGRGREPRGPRARPARYRRPNLRFERGLVEDFDEPVRRDRLPADDRAHRRARRPARPLRRRRPGRLRLDAEPADAGAARGAEKSDNPWHLREYTAAEYRELLEPRFARVELLGVFHARKLRAARAGDPSRLGPGSPGAAASPGPSTTASCRRSPPRDFALCGAARGRPRPGARLPRRLPLVSPADRSPPAVGSIAIVLHSHMPYVEGFGTYPVRRGVAVRRRDPLLPPGAASSPSG